MVISDDAAAAARGVKFRTEPPAGDPVELSEAITASRVETPSAMPAFTASAPTSRPPLPKSANTFSTLTPRWRATAATNSSPRRSTTACNLERPASVVGSTRLSGDWLETISMVRMPRASSTLRVSRMVITAPTEPTRAVGATKTFSAAEASQ